MNNGQNNNFLLNSTYSSELFIGQSTSETSLLIWCDSTQSYFL